MAIILEEFSELLLQGEYFILGIQDLSLFCGVNMLPRLSQETQSRSLSCLELSLGVCVCPVMDRRPVQGAPSSCKLEICNS